MLSVGAPGRRERSPELIDWIDTHSDALFLSAVTVAEVSGGIAKMKRTGSASRAAGLGDWLEVVLHLYGERVLPFDVSAARLAGELTDKARAAGHTAGFADVAIAATAGSHGLTILTRKSSPLHTPRHPGGRPLRDIALTSTAVGPTLTELNCG